MFKYRVIHITTFMFSLLYPFTTGGGRVVRRCWVNFQCQGVLLIRIIVGQGPIALAIGAGGGCLDIFSLNYHFFSFSLSLGDGLIWTEILSQRAVKSRTTNQPTFTTYYHVYNIFLCSQFSSMFTTVFHSNLPCSKQTTMFTKVYHNLNSLSCSQLSMFTTFFHNNLQ